MSSELLETGLERVRLGVPLDDAFEDFLDAFFLASTPEAKLEILSARPSLTGDRRLDALAGAVVDYLSRQHSLPSVPKWTYEPERFLEHPWHMCAHEDLGRREYLTFASPAEFKTRNVFTVERPLNWGRKTSLLS
jgi:hypothetical protein